AELLRSLRVHGQGANKYDNVRVGINARLDTIQAAILIEKLRIFEEELRARRVLAGRYSVLAGAVELPPDEQGVDSAWGHFTIRIPGGRRGSVASGLRRGVGR